MDTQPAEEPQSTRSQARLRVLVSLAANGGLLFVLSCLLCQGPHVPAGAAVLSFVMPPWGSVEFLVHGDMGWGSISLGVTVGAVLFISLAILRPRPVPILSAHVALVLYFLWGLVLVGLAV